MKFEGSRLGGCHGFQCSLCHLVVRNHVNNLPDAGTPVLIGTHGVEKAVSVSGGSVRTQTAKVSRVVVAAK